MAEIAHGAEEAYEIMHPTRDEVLRHVVLTLDRAKTLLREGQALRLYVTGWSEPWPCLLDEDGTMRARCPTASEWVRPRVVPAGCGTDLDPLGRGGVPCVLPAGHEGGHKRAAS